ncbi:hypothetical protein P7C70_g2295, partial [Phenoliferia sp. Uapishka_3]
MTKMVREDPPLVDCDDSVECIPAYMERWSLPPSAPAKIKENEVLQGFSPLTTLLPPTPPASPSRQRTMAFNLHSCFSFISDDSPSHFPITRASFSANYSPTSSVFSDCPESPDIPQLELSPSTVVTFPTSPFDGTTLMVAEEDDDATSYNQRQQWQSGASNLRRRSITNTTPDDWAIALGTMKTKQDRKTLGKRVLAVSVVATTGAVIFLRPFFGL